ncbi:MAG TPA: hypothetical protein VGW33_12570 [Terriglobia bacterium]|nr:hypothetical protein [Terriglobia bacterium]
MSDKQEDDKQPQVHYEGGVPILDFRVSEVERKQAEAESRDQQYKNDQIALNRRLVKATVALVIATIVMGAVGGIQLWYMHRQWKLNAEGLSKLGDQIWAAKDAAYASKQASDTAAKTLPQMKAQTAAQEKAANAAKSAAVAANSQADISRKALNATITAMNVDQRPWVSVVDVVTDDGVATHDTFTFQGLELVILNTGKTPALKVGKQCCIVRPKLWSDPIPDYDREAAASAEENKALQEQTTAEMIKQNPTMKEEIVSGMKEFEASRAAAIKEYTYRGEVLPPGVPRKLPLLRPDSWARRNKDHLPMFLYVLGKITYSDLLTRKEHTTKFCLRYTTGTSFEICPKGNWMD